MSGPQISVIIPALNAADVLASQLDAMLVQDPSVDWELVIVDNGSDDDTSAVAHSYSTRLPSSVVYERRRGANRARNAGLAATSAEKVLFTDADDIVGPLWVRTMAEAIRPGSIVGGWLERRYLPPDIERCIDDTPISAVFQGEWLAYPIGCCMGWDRALLERIGGFDNILTYGGDEVDAAWRAQLLGAEIVQAKTDAVMIRRERSRLDAMRHQARSFGKAEVMLARRFAVYGHPGRLRRRSAWRATKSAVRVVVDRGPNLHENRRSLAYHGAAAHQVLRYTFHVDTAPEPAQLVL